MYLRSKTIFKKHLIVNKFLHTFFYILEYVKRVRNHDILHIRPQHVVPGKIYIYCLFGDQKIISTGFHFI